MMEVARTCACAYGRHEVLNGISFDVQRNEMLRHHRPGAVRQDLAAPLPQPHH